MLRNRAKCALKFQEALIRINFIGFFLAFIAQGSADPIYMAFAPKMIRPSRPYNISLLVQNSSRPISVELELVESITKVDGTPQLKTHISTEAVLQPNSQVSQVSFTAPDSLLPGDYKLKIRGSDGGSFKFENETDLSYDGKSKSIFVQSDKAIYKPGDKVRFRVIIVDPDLKPYAGVADIYVHDPDGNRIHQWLGISEAKVNGVYSREVQLSADPMLGDWKITVIARGEKLDKFFTVQEYVLPKFEVKLKLPPFALIDDKTVDFDVRAEYTYGKAVEGQLKVTAEKYPDYNFPKAEHTTKQSKFKGVHSVSLPMSQLVNYEEFISQGSIAIEATVTDKLTGIAQTATGNIVIYKYPIKIIVEKTSETFKPGLKYTAFIKVLTHDDRPVTKWPAKINVTISGGNENEPELFETHNLYPVPSNGVIEIVTYPSRNLTNLWLRASLPDNDEPYINIDAASSRSRNFLQAVAVNDVALPAQDLALVLNCTEALHTVSYTVLSRGSIVASGNWNLNGKTTDKVFIRVTSEMAPKARILVSYIREDGEVVADSFDLDANGLFRNQVTLSVKAKQRQEYAMPGEDAVIRVSSSPDSYVALLGVDQSVLLLKDGNDITQEMVKDEIAGYSTTFDNDMWGGPWGRGVPFRRRKRSMYFGFSSSDAQDVIENAGLIVLTNAYVHDQDMYLGRQFDSGELMFEAMPVPRLGTGRVVNNLAEPQGRSGGTGSNLVLRKEFPETWLWEDARSSGDWTFTKKVPDTITSWVVTAFCINDIHGLGVVDSPSRLKVFRPFFISLNLPYSIVRGETLYLQTLVFNYLNQDQEVNVVLTNSGEFEFASNDAENTIGPSIVTLQTNQRKIIVKANSGSTLTFPIVATKLGKIKIKVTATSDQAGDSVERKLLVKAEGTERNVNHPWFIDLSKADKLTQSFEVLTPNDTNKWVRDSLKMEVSVVGDTMGTTLNGLEKLLKMPYGCGEQNMVNFAPNIYVTDYLERVERLSEETRAKAINFMKSGYQRELKYKHLDSSFSAFGESDEVGSTWLTAFVTKSFHEAKGLIDIDEDIQKKSLAWLVEQQSTDGSFVEKGKVFHKAMQGGSSKGLALTAYVLISLLENKVNHVAVQKAIGYLEGNLDGIKDNAYALAITAYALDLAGTDSEARNLSLSYLEDLVRVDADKMFWSTSKQEDTSAASEEEKLWRILDTPSLDVETAAYALLTYARMRNKESGLLVMKWLLSKRNRDGGFVSTQDTVIGLQALSEFASIIYSPDQNIKIVFRGLDSKGEIVSKESFKASGGNALVLQTAELPSEIRKVEIEASGIGTALAQLSYSYNVLEASKDKAFELNAKVMNRENDIVVSACSKYLKAGESNMAVLEVEMPTSYEVDGELAKLLTQRDPLLQKVEISESNTKIMLYYDKVTSRESCIELVGYPMYLAENLKNKTMILYDYYEPSESTAVNYRTSRSVDMKELLADEAQPISASLGAVESFSLRQTSSCVFLVIFSVLSSFSFR